MLCPKCNQENPDDAKFCGNCGATFGAPRRSPTSAPARQSSDDGEPVSSNLNIGVIIGTIFIPLLGIIMGAIFMQDPNPKKKAAGKLWLQIGIGWAIVSCLLAAMCGVFGNM
jgi:uncharacterized membrane protein YvbJ